MTWLYSIFNQESPTNCRNLKLMTIPRDCRLGVLEYLTIPELAKFALTCREGRVCVAKSLKNRAKRFGFKGRENQAIRYLKCTAKTANTSDLDHFFKGSSPLHDQLNLKKVIHWSRLGVDINFQDRKGCTPLHKAMDKPKKLVKKLLHSGANPNIQDANGRTALFFARMHQREDLVRILLKRKADPHIADKDGHTVLTGFAQANETDAIDDFKLVEVLLQHGSLIHHQTSKTRNSALHISASKGCEQSVKVLLDAGANTELKNAEGDTPLFLAAYHGRTTIVKLLIANGASVNAFNNQGDTPLHASVSGKRLDVSSELLKNGANVDMRSSQGQTALHLAAMEGHPDVVKLLLRWGANRNIKDLKGLLPVDLACVELFSEEHLEVVSLLERITLYSRTLSLSRIFMSAFA